MFGKNGLGFRAGSAVHLLGCLALLATTGAAPCLASESDLLVVRKMYGYIFVDGAYISAPYEIEYSEDVVRINDLEFDKDSFDLSNFEELPARNFGPWRRGRGFNGRYQSSPINDAGFVSQDSTRGGFGRRTSFDRFCDELRGVNDGMIAVLYTGDAPLFVQQFAGRHEFVRALHIPEASAEPIPPIISAEKDRATWNRLLDDFKGDREFDRRVEEEIRMVDAAEADGDRVMAGTKWMEKLSYPISILAMVLVVIGFGHLLNNRPTVEALDAESVYWSNQRRVVAQSLLIVGLLSAIDLIWTISASNAGMMKEMNPLASHLISDPFRLFFFKATVTATSIGILYWLHRRPIAQMASWWSCLLLTLLTARWVVFHSMFL